MYVLGILQASFSLSHRKDQLFMETNLQRIMLLYSYYRSIDILTILYIHTYLQDNEKTYWLNLNFIVICNLYNLISQY